MPKQNILVLHSPNNGGEKIKQILNATGYQLTFLPDPQKVEPCIRDFSPDLILIEEHFGEKDGFKIGVNIIEKFFYIPVIFLASHESQFNAENTLRVGFADYMVHPLQPAYLISSIDRALTQRRRIQDYLDKAFIDDIKNIKNQLDIYETVQSVARSVAGSLDLDRILKTVVDAAVDITNAEEGILLLLDENSGELYIRAERNIQDEMVRTFRLPVEDTLAGQVLRTGTAVKIESETPQKIKTSYFVYALIYVPIRIHERILGVLGVDNRQSKQAFTEDHLAIVTSLADYAAIAIENARLFLQSELKRNQLEAILTNVADGVIVLGNDGCLLLVNRAARTIFGLNEDDPTGKPYQDVFNNPEFIEILDTVESSPKRSEISIENGRIYNINVTSISEIGYTLTMQDITHLKELDRIKSDFVNTVSHDLRSPLTAILGYIELIDRAGSINDQQREFIKRVQFSVNNITSLINDLLDLGRIEAGFDARKEFVHIPMIIQYAVEGLSSRIENKDQVVVSTIADDLPVIFGNPVRLRQMISNIIGNAIKYTPPKGRIEINVREESGQIIISISDNGPGIPPADQPYIFDKFYRGSNVPYDTPGTGLGLAIVSSIVENHQGRIWVESNPGDGTTFAVVLPIADREI